MSKSSDALLNVLENWKTLKSTRAAERDFTPYGYPLSFDSIDSILDRISSIVQILDKKGYWATSPEVAIADAPIATSLTNLNNLILSGQQNGINWLLSAGFLDSLNLTRHLVTSLGIHQSKLVRELSKTLADKSEADLEAIVQASKIANRISSLEKSAIESSEEIESVRKEIEEATQASDEKKKIIEELANSSEEQSSKIRESLQQASKLLEETASLRALAEDRETKLQEQVGAVREKIEQTNTLAKEAIDSVKTALRDVRTQGLAGSFQKRSDKLRAERRLWILSFLGAASILGLLAVVFVLEIDKVTYESLIVHLLRKFGLAAPFIWVGWYSARQIGRVSKVQEDYEYKAATALAFQSYRDEVKINGDEALVNKLLEQAIQTFGENPVRLYVDLGKDPVSPIQAAIQDLPPEKIAAILAAVGDQTLKRKIWPFN